MKYHTINNLESIMIDILCEGEKEIWQTIEQETNALIRAEKRKLFAKAMKKIKP